MKSKNPYKKQRLEERILFELNRILRTETSDARLNRVTITKVEVNRDYSQAQVYWDIYDGGQKEESEQAVMGAAKRLRTMLATVLEMRKMPLLLFQYDSQFDAEKNIVEILNAEKKRN